MYSRKGSTPWQGNKIWHNWKMFWTFESTFHTQTQGHVLCMSKTCGEMNYRMLMCVCVDQMGKRRFSGLEVSLMVLFSLVLVVAVAMVVLLATGEPGTMKEGMWSDNYRDAGITTHMEIRNPWQDKQASLQKYFFVR